MQDRSRTDFFGEIERRLAASDPKVPLELRRDRWVLLTMLVGIVMTVPSMLGMKGDWAAWIALAGLVLELCGISVLAYRQIRDVAPELKDAKQKFAAELDVQFRNHQDVVAWLRSFPEIERRRRLTYIESRLESMSHRYPIAFGAVDKLGFLPLLVAVFMQWQAIEQLSFAVGIFAFFIFVMYGMALWLVRFRLQMQSYARLMRAADAPD
jgi:hypothetical protein